MKQIVFATNNETKGKRFSEGLLNNGIEVLTLKDLNINLDVVEDGTTVIDNALIKARACFNKTNIISLGMDDSLYIEGIPDSKQPRLSVRRVNGKSLSDEEMIEYYTNLIREYGINGRLNCKWIYGLAIIDSYGKESTYTWDKDNFYMVDKASNKINPGYPLNSISKYKVLDKYFTEVREEEKDLIKYDENHVVDFIVKTLNKKI